MIDKNKNSHKILGIDLGGLNFLKTLQHNNPQFAIIGLGRFGKAVCQTLYKMGYEVLGIDVNEKLVAQIITEKMASNAIQLDCTEANALKEAGIFEFDTVIVAIGNYLEESVITTLNVKEAGVKFVVAKASSEIHGKLLKRVGADLVVYPEYEAGCELAYTLTKPAILERFVLDPNSSIVEVLIPEAFEGKTLAAMNLRSDYGVNVLAIGNDDKFLINPEPSYTFQKGLSMIVIGSNDDIHRLPM